MGGKTKITIAMLIYGSIGIFIRHIKMPAIEIAFLRSIIGSVFLIVVSLVANKLDLRKFHEKGLWVFLVSGVALGVNWVFLFKAFELTSISSAILVYYLAPIFVIMLSPLLLGDTLSKRKMMWVLIAFIGLVLIVLNNFSIVKMDVRSIQGILFALLAALFYASVILMNKRVSNMISIETTIIQLLASTLVLSPILIINNGFSIPLVDSMSIGMIFILGVLHTGIAYMLYFASMKTLKAQTVAMYCYIDPISAVLYAFLLLSEKISLAQMIGGGLILASTYFIDKQNDE